MATQAIEAGAKPRRRLWTFVLAPVFLALSSLIFPAVRGQLLVAAFAFDDVELRAWAVDQLAGLGDHGIEGLTLAVADQAERREAFDGNIDWSRRRAVEQLSREEDQILVAASRALGARGAAAAPAIPYLLRCSNGGDALNVFNARFAGPAARAIHAICERDPEPLLSIALDRKEALARRSCALSFIKALRKTNPELALRLLPGLQDARFHIRNETLAIVVHTEPPPAAMLPAIFRMKSFPANTEPYHIICRGELTVFETAAYRLGPQLIPELLRLSGDLEFRRDATAVLEAHEADRPEEARRFLELALASADPEVVRRAEERLRRLNTRDG